MKEFSFDDEEIKTSKDSMVMVEHMHKESYREQLTSVADPVPEENEPLETWEDGPNPIQSPTQNTMNDVLLHTTQTVPEKQEPVERKTLVDEPVVRTREERKEPKQKR